MLGGEHVEVVDNGPARLAPIVRVKASTNTTVPVHQQRDGNDFRLVREDLDPVVLVGRVRVGQKFATIEMLDSSEPLTVMTGLSFEGDRLLESLEFFCWSRRPKVVSLTQPTRMKAANDWQSTEVHWPTPRSLPIPLEPRGKFGGLDALPRTKFGKRVGVPVLLPAALACAWERVLPKHLNVLN